MTEGDGIRRNVAYIDPTEKQHLRDAIKALNTKFYPGSREDKLDGGPGHVSYWFKQDQIHRATHVHHGPSFLPWHRELCNRFEALLREVDSRLSLHYWNWTTDPNPLFTSDFMGSAHGPVGEPWLSAGFYNPTGPPDRVRATDDPIGNAADPPKFLERDVKAGPVSSLIEDNGVIYAEYFLDMRKNLETIHDRAHPHIGGTIGNPHTAFRDPFVFLLHSNVDRLFAMWQLQHPEWRLDPNLVYGEESGTTGRNGILTPMEPWANMGVDEDWFVPLRPWSPPEKKMVTKTSKHISVVIPPVYDTSLRSLASLPEMTIRRGFPESRLRWAKVEKSWEVEQMPSDLGVFAERLGHIEERLATMESFIRPDERRQQLHKKDPLQAKKINKKQT